MKIRRRKRQGLQVTPINGCFICGEVKPCSYELLNVQRDPVCGGCVKERREQLEQERKESLHA